MKITEFVAQLEYYLSQIALKNEHHRFERLCTEVARRRIANNIFLATGPVGSGGDGGRDSESFDTQLPYEITTWFSVRATTASVAMACSTERDYTRKIRDDVDRILLAQDRTFDRIVYFSNQPIPSGKRLELQRKLTNAIPKLAIWDRYAIARVLAEPDLQWLAQHYLDIPSALIESLEPDYEFAADLDNEVFCTPAQALVDALEFALELSPAESGDVDFDLRNLQRRHVALHLALDTLPITPQHAYELSRQADESAYALRRFNSSGAEALRAYGLLP